MIASVDALRWWASTFLFLAARTLVRNHAGRRFQALLAAAARRPRVTEAAAPEPRTFMRAPSASTNPTVEWQCFQRGL